MPALIKKEKKKAERAEKLRKNISKVRTKIRKDLDSSEVGSKTFCLALSVALIDETYARVGNKNSEEENGHFGVTGWQKKHLKFKDGEAIISYVGKSGVSHKKTVRDSAVVKALRKLHKATENPGDSLLRYDYQDEKARLNAKDVNSYLEPFEVTAKDIRGFHANEEMRKKLLDLRKENGALPEDKSERETQLDKEFKEALESISKCLGHEPSTLRNQYLVHNFEKTFLSEGKPMEKFSRVASVARAALSKYAALTYFKTPEFPGSLDLDAFASLHRALHFSGTQDFEIQVNVQKSYVLVNLQFDYNGEEDRLALLMRETAWGTPWKMWRLAGKWNVTFKYGR